MATKKGPITELMEALRAQGIGVRAAGGIGDLLEAVIDGGVSSRAKMIELANDSMEDILNHDGVSKLTPGPHHWTRVTAELAEPLTYVNCEPGPAVDGDVHVHVLQRDTGNAFHWRLWVLCHLRGVALPLNLIGDEARVMHRANVMLDTTPGRITVDQLWEAAGRKKRAPASGGKDAAPFKDGGQPTGDGSTGTAEPTQGSNSPKAES